MSALITLLVVIPLLKEFVWMKHVISLVIVLETVAALEAKPVIKYRWTVQRILA
jgi:hypothetical protein